MFVLAIKAVITIALFYKTTTQKNPFNVQYKYKIISETQIHGSANINLDDAFYWLASFLMFMINRLLYS